MNMLLGAPSWALGTAMPMFDPNLVEVRAQALGQALGLTRTRWVDPPHGLGAVTEYATTTIGPYVPPSPPKKAAMRLFSSYTRPAAVTFQGFGARYAGGEEEPTLHGLGLTRARWGDSPMTTANLHGFFDSPLWRHRKWIVLGGVGLLGLGLLGLAGALLK